MEVVSDRGMDMSAEQLEGLDLHLVPLSITLDGKTYVSDVDIRREEFYDILLTAEGLPTTSLPSPGEFAEIYRELVQSDPDILSVHISSGLSGTYNSALEGAKLVPEARITVWDTMTLSGAEGWQVEAAARMAKAEWPLDRILATLEQVREVTETIFTLPELKWLIHGGRISHIKGLLASVLNIKPIIGVSKVDGKYFQRDRARTFSRAMRKLIDVMAEDVGRGVPIRVQVMHANAPEDAEELRALVDEAYECTWLPISSIAPVLGAHTGPGLVGMAYAPLADFPELP
ncbi:MAG: DegV family protein [Anaerolineales bacterium]